MSPRLWIAAMLAYGAYRVAPPPMKPMFRVYHDLLTSFACQLRDGLGYGVVVAGWSRSVEFCEQARVMEDAAIIGAKKARKELEDAE